MQSETFLKTAAAGNRDALYSHEKVTIAWIVSVIWAEYWRWEGILRSRWEARAKFLKGQTLSPYCLIKTIWFSLCFYLMEAFICQASHKHKGLKWLKVRLIIWMTNRKSQISFDCTYMIIPSFATPSDYSLHACIWLLKSMWVGILSRGKWKEYVTYTTLGPDPFRSLTTNRACCMAVI